MTHCVHVVLQVTLPVVGQDDAAQLAVTSEVEAGIGGEHQQTGHVPPADLLLGTSDSLLVSVSHTPPPSHADGRPRPKSNHLTDGHLHDGVEAPFRRVQVA